MDYSHRENKLEKRVSIRKTTLLLTASTLAISGCSSIGNGWNNTVDFISGPDAGAGKRQEAAAKMASDTARSANS